MRLKTNPFCSTLRIAAQCLTLDGDLRMEWKRLPKGMGAGYNHWTNTILMPAVNTMELSEDEARKLNAFSYHERLHHFLTSEDLMAKAFVYDNPEIKNEVNDFFGKMKKWSKKKSGRQPQQPKNLERGMCCTLTNFIEDCRIEMNEHCRFEGDLEDLLWIRTGMMADEFEKEYEECMTMNPWGAIMQTLQYNLCGYRHFVIDKKKFPEQAQMYDIAWDIINDGRFAKSCKHKVKGSMTSYELAVEIIEAWKKATGRNISKEKREQAEPQEQEEQNQEDKEAQDARDGDNQLFSKDQNDEDQEEEASNEDSGSNQNENPDEDQEKQDAEKGQKEHDEKKSGSQSENDSDDENDGDQNGDSDGQDEVEGEEKEDSDDASESGGESPSNSDKENAEDGGNSDSNQDGEGTGDSQNDSEDDGENSDSHQNGSQSGSNSDQDASEGEGVAQDNNSQDSDSDSQESEESDSSGKDMSGPIYDSNGRNIQKELKRDQSKYDGRYNINPDKMNQDIADLAREEEDEDGSGGEGGNGGMGSPPDHEVTPNPFDIGNGCNPLMLKVMKTPYVPYDVLDRLCYPKLFPENYSQVKETIDSKIKSVTRELTRLLVSESQTRTRKYLKKGKIDRRRLHAVVHGDERIFKKTKKGESHEVAVQLIIDLSGSMSGHKARLAVQVACLFSEVLNAMSMPFEVIGYNTSSLPSKHATIAKKNGLSRFDIVNHWVFKEFHESWPAVHARLGACCNGMRLNFDYPDYFDTDEIPIGKKVVKDLDGCVGGCNCDHETVLLGASRLYVQPQDRKIQIIIADGLPNGYHGDYGGQLQHMLVAVNNRIIKAGIEQVAFGIDCDGVEHYYSKSVVIRNIDDLGREALHYLSHSLRNYAMKEPDRWST